MAGSRQDLGVSSVTRPAARPGRLFRPSESQLLAAIPLKVSKHSTQCRVIMHDIAIIRGYLLIGTLFVRYVKQGIAPERGLSEPRPPAMTINSSNQENAEGKLPSVHLDTPPQHLMH